MEKDQENINECDSSYDSSDSSLVANYGEEIHFFRTYQYKDGNDELDLIKVRIRSALSTRGRNLIIPGNDSTGIMIWPASYLLCQYLTYVLSMPSSSATYEAHSYRRILELGGGCGSVSITAACTWRQFRKKDDEHLDIISTDMDQLSIDLCSENIELNNLGECVGEEKVRLKARTMCWGDMDRVEEIISEFRVNEKADLVIGADIVYPDTSEVVLSYLFKTVSATLKNNGHFLLSFVNRDYFVSAARLINAANDACFKIDYIPMSSFVPDACSKFLPPMLDAKLLTLARASKDIAFEHNNSLGFEDCEIFPGLRATLARAEEESSLEDWEPPGFASDESD